MYRETSNFYSAARFISVALRHRLMHLESRTIDGFNSIFDG